MSELDEEVAEKLALGIYTDKQKEEFTQTNSFRSKLITQLIKSDGQIDLSEPKLVSAALKAADGIDSQAFNQARIQLSVKEVDAMQNSNEIMAETLKSINLRKYMAAQNTGNRTTELPNDIPLGEIIPGELEITPNQENYESFMARMNK